MRGGRIGGRGGGCAEIGGRSRARVHGRHTGRKCGGPDKRGPISVQPVRPERGADPGSVRRGTSPVDDHRVHGTR